MNVQLGSNTSTPWPRAWWKWQCCTLQSSSPARRTFRRWGSVKGNILKKNCVSVLVHLAHKMEYFMLVFGPWPIFLDWGHFYLFFFAGESRSLEYSEGGVTACWLYWMWNKGSQVCIKIIALNPRVQIQIQLGPGPKTIKKAEIIRFLSIFGVAWGFIPEADIGSEVMFIVQLEKH